MKGPAFRDLGHKVYVSMHTCSHSPNEWSGAIVGFVDKGPMPTNQEEANEMDFGERRKESEICQGGISWCPLCDGATWRLVSLLPLHIDPSVACKTHPQHHGWIREGIWVPA